MNALNLYRTCATLLSREMSNPLSAMAPEALAVEAPSRPGNWRQRLVPARRELLLFVALIFCFNIPMLWGGFSQNFILDPSAVQAGQWWRIFSHPFVHVTWYHLLLDGLAFLFLYSSLLEASLVRRLLYVSSGVAGSLLCSWLAAPNLSTSGLCGLSGIAHGLMAVSALEMVTTFPAKSAEWYWGWMSFAMVVGKAALEGLTGRMLFTFFDFGMLGTPVAVSHAGGVIGALLAVLIFRYAKAQNPS